MKNITIIFAILFALMGCQSPTNQSQNQNHSPTAGWVVAKPSTGHFAGKCLVAQAKDTLFGRKGAFLNIHSTPEWTITGPMVIVEGSVLETLKQFLDCSDTNTVTF